MFTKLGYGGGNSLLAGLAIFIGIPFPIWIYYAGERMRAKSPLARWYKAMIMTGCKALHSMDTGSTQVYIIVADLKIGY